MAPARPYRRPLASYPPLGSLIRLWYAVALLARLPWWFVKYAILRFRRPHPSWGLWQTISTRMIKFMVDGNSRTEKPTRLSLKPGREGDRFVVLQPAEASLYRGPLAPGEAAGTFPVPVPIGATWYPKAHRDASELLRGKGKGEEEKDDDENDDSDNDERLVVLHLHGGAFVINDGRSATSGFGAAALERHAGAAAVLAPQYRLACRPDPQPFPAALQDALTAYAHLTRGLGLPGGRVVVSGDSAGGNLAVGMLRYLAEHGAGLGLPPPRNALLFSPWVDVALCVPGVSPTSAGLAITTNPSFAADYLPLSFVRWGAAAYVGAAGAAAADPADPYVSPAGHPFATPVPVFVNVGTAELLAVEGRRWVAEMAAVPGNRVRAHHEAHAPHDTILIGGQSGWADSAHEATHQAGLFLREMRTEE